MCELGLASAAGVQNDLPFAFRVATLLCLGADRDGVWRYLPLRAGLRRDSDGHPLVSFVEAGGKSFLMLTATWGADARDVAALRAVVASRSGQPDSFRVRVGFAPLSEVGCRLVSNGATLAASETSGAPPYDAVLSVAVGGDVLETVRRALRGDDVSLRVQYDAALAVPQRATATLAARGGRLRDWLGDLPLDRSLLEAAVREGVADLRVDSSGAKPGALWDDLYERLLDEGTRNLAAADWTLDGDVDVTATLEWSLSHRVGAGVDVAQVLATNGP